MTYKKIFGGLAILVILVLAGGTIASYWIAQKHAQSSTPTAPLITQKKNEIAALDKLNDALLAPDESKWNPLDRKQTLRDSGRKGAGLFIRHAFFRIAGGIGFKVDTLSALLVPKKAGDPIILDDPTSFVFKPLHGSVVLPPSSLTALFNQYLTDYPGTQLRHIQIKTTDDGLLEVSGQTQKIPGVWLPFQMKGPVRLVDGHLFVYSPNHIQIAHIDAKGLLKLIRLQLSQLVQIDTSGAQLTGDSIVLDLDHSLPPPDQDVDVASMKIDSSGVHMKFKSAFDPSWPKPIVDTGSYVMIDGGDIKTFRALITHVRMQLVAANGGRLDTSLYNYRKQIVDGHFDITRAGELVAYLAPFSPAIYVPAANPAKKDEDSQ